MIDKAKKGAIIDSFYGYKKAIENFYIQQFSENQEFKLDGTYIVNNGNLGGHKILFNGHTPKTGVLIYSKNQLENGFIIIEDYIITIKNNEITIEKNKFPFGIEIDKNGLYTSNFDENRYLYRGKEPDNYIILPEKGIDTLYRIISYESDGTIKVIRNDKIADMAWDVSSDANYSLPWDSGTVVNIKTRFKKSTYCAAFYGCNAWGTQTDTYIGDETLETKLGEFKYAYYSNKSETNLQYSSWTGTVKNEASINIILNQYWINNLDIDIKNQISKHTFNVGGLYYYNGYSGGDKGLEREKQELSTYNWIGNIGLIDITDMVESSTNLTCTSVWSNYLENNKHNGWPCNYENGNWLDKNDGVKYWTISPYSYYNGTVWVIDPSGYFYRHGTIDKLGIRPVFFLKSSTVLQGEGTISNPYRIVS